jgi:CzcA family heavy metal efflux pump
MMRGIIQTSIHFRFLVVVLALAMLAFGAFQLRNMPVDVLPEFSPTYVEIQTEALGLSAEEVEQMITVPMEQDLLAGVAWVDVIRSESVPGLSSVLLYFEPGTDLYKARQMVSERLSQAAVGLPHVSKPPTMIQPLSSSSRFMIVGLSSKELTLIEMSVLARWVIGPRLLGVPGVANVAIWGNRDRQLQVLVDPEQLREAGVSLQQVIETTGNALWVSSLSYLEASTPGTGGFIDTPSQRIGIWHVLPISSPEELAQVPVKATAWRLGDVAKVVEDHQPLIGDALVEDDPNLLLVVEKLPGTNTLEVTRGVENALEALRPGMAGLEFDTSLFRPATFIEIAIANLRNALLLSVVLVVVALLFLFWGWRTALISFLVIPVSLVAALLVLYLRGSTVNIMLLAGLAAALGALIDDAIVDVENMLRGLRQRRQEGANLSTEEIVLEASLEMRSAITFAMLIMLLAVLPLLLLAGVSGAFFRPLAISYGLALLASMLVALILTPALSAILLPSAPLERRQSPLLAWLQVQYERALDRTMHAPRPVFGALALVLAVSLVMIPFFRQESLLPSFKEPDLLIQLESAPATSRPEMDRIVARISQELRAIPGVNNVGAHVGRAIFGDQVVGINSAQVWVNLDPASDYQATRAAIQETMEAYPGLSVQVSSNLRQTLSEALTRSGDTVVVRIFGDDPRLLRSKTEEIRQAISGIEGIADLHVVLPIEEPTLEIEVDLTKAQRYGIKPGDVRRVAATLLSGLQVGSLFEEQKVFDVVVWGVPEIRDSLDDVRQLLIETPSGGHVRLSDVAEVRFAPVPTVIRREGISPYLDVGFDVRGRDLGSVTRDVENALEGIQFPLEYHAEVLGEFAERQAAQQRMLVAGIVAAFGIFLLLQASSGNWRLAFFTFLTLPAALAGGALVVLLGGGVLTLGSLLGFLTLLGMAVRNSVVLTNHYRHLEQQEGEPFGPQLIQRGARERVRPILMTAITTGLAFAPFAILGDIPGLEILQPLANVVLAGLVTSTLLTLVVTPTLYLHFGARREADLELDLVPATATD